MIGGELPDDSHVVRYIRPTLIEDGKVLAGAFRLRKGESGLSIHWLECFNGLVKPRQLDEVRRLCRLRTSSNGQFAELHAGRTKQHVMEKLNTVRFIHKPLDADASYEADPSHSEIVGLPPQDSSLRSMIGAMIAECIETTYPGTQ